MLSLPSPRGPVTEMLLEELLREPHPLPSASARTADSALAADDLQLTLYLCYELHYRGLPGVDERWEWDPSLLALRATLERSFEQALLDAIPFLDEPVDSGDIDLALRAIADEDGGPSLSSYIRSRATLEEIREFVIHRSAGEGQSSGTWRCSSRFRRSRSRPST